MRARGLGWTGIKQRVMEKDLLSSQRREGGPLSHRSARRGCERAAPRSGLQRASSAPWNAVGKGGGVERRQERELGRCCTLALKTEEGSTAKQHRKPVEAGKDEEKDCSLDLPERDTALRRP